MPSPDPKPNWKTPRRVATRVEPSAPSPAEQPDSNPDPRGAGSRPTPSLGPEERTRPEVHSAREASDRIKVPSPGDQAPAGNEKAPTGPTGAPAATTAPVMVNLGHLRASDWRPEVLRDTILPTRPLPLSQAESVETMRESLIREKLARMPKSLAHPRVVRGFAFEFAAKGDDAPVWRGAPDAQKVGTVRGTRAELTLEAGDSDARTYILSSGTGRPIAVVTVGRDGTPSLNAAQGTRSSYWLGVEHPKAEGAFSWRLASGEAVPDAWKRDDQWDGGRGQRVDIPLQPPGTGPNRYAIELVDPSTGCGLTCSVLLD